jgi:hypothetical protein
MILRTWQILILGALWLFFEFAISDFATCKPPYEEATNYSGKENDCTFFNGPVTSIAIVFFRFLHTYEHELIAGFTIALAAFTGTLWWSTRKLWKAGEEQIAVAKRAADVAEKTLVASQRPWISLKEAKVLAPMYFAKGDVHFPLEFQLKNTGNSPGLFVHIEAKRFALRAETYDIVAVQKEVRQIAQARDSHKSEVGMSIFPGDVRPVEKIVSALRADLKKGFFDLWSAGSTKKAVSLVVAGCVDYEFSFEKGHHQSGFVYQVTAPSGAVIFREQGAVEGIKLVRLPGGETAN